MNSDRGLFISLTAVLCGIGVLMVYSASITSWPTDFEQVYLSRHIVYLLIGARPRRLHSRCHRHSGDAARSGGFF